MDVKFKKTNPDIEKERRSASFDTEEFASWWNGGVEKLKEKRELENYIFNDPDLKEDEIAIQYMSYQEMYDKAIEKYLIFIKKLKKFQDEKDPNGTDIFPGKLSSQFVRNITPQGSPFLLHHSMFMPAIKGHGTPEQVQKFIPKANNFQIIGTYAQTELGHGTFLRGLETRADFDRETDEFVLNSPTITAFKWWPGGLGHTANYAVVAAQLHIDGKQHGIQMFIVPLRDEETHMPLKGIQIGDIGNKMAFQTVNNGYLGFDKVRIPRTNMLMKNAQVRRDGSFVKSPASVLSYFTMVEIRVSIVTFSYYALARSVTIATRYSAVRRQSQINPKEPEHQIIDHLTQQLKLFPQISITLVLKLTAAKLNSMFETVQTELLQGDLSRLAEMHALASCLKAISTRDATSGVEILRLACGGHGYMLASGLPSSYNFVSASITYEGENTVLLLQTARFLIKSWALALKGSELVPTVNYLGEVVRSKTFQKWDGSWQCMVKCLQFVAANKIRIAFDHLEARKQRNMVFEEALNLTSIELAAAAEMHGRAFLANTAASEVLKTSVSASMRAVLSDLLELYLVRVCLDKMSDILRFIPLTEENISDLQARLERSLARIRPNAVAIVDGFDYHDRVLGSVLGCYDGNIYERIFESAQKSPMNKIPVQKSYEEHLKPFLKSKI